MIDIPIDLPYGACVKICSRQIFGSKAKITFFALRVLKKAGRFFQQPAGSQTDWPVLARERQLPCKARKEGKFAAIIA
jgi:hypothetical protein